MPTQINLMGTGCSPLQAQASVGILSNNLTATGSSSQANALALPSDFNIFTTVAANTGGRLPASGNGTNPGDTYIVVNHGASTLTIYPATGGTIANGSANAGFSVSATKTATFTYLGSNNWAAAVSA